MKNIFRISVVILLFVLMHSCRKDKLTPPTLTTNAITEISYTTATSGGDVTNEGGAPLIIRGVCWNTSAEPTISNSKTAGAGGLGTFTTTLNLLTPGTSYYVRAYATNSAGTGYGNQVTFTTLPEPSGTGFSPVIGQVGTVVTINGDNFSNVLSNNEVEFNGVPAVINSATETTIVTKVPEGATSGKITVKIGEKIFTFPDDFIVIIPPSITGFTPKNGTMGSQITLTGAHFNTEISGNTVRMNDLIAAVTYASANELKIIVPEGAISGKISLTIGEITTTTTDNFTVTDFENIFVLRGLFVSFERRGWASGYYSGDAINQFNDFDSVVGSTVAQEIALQLDEMKKIGVNFINFELRSSDSYWNPGPFLPPECNIGPSLGLQYPSPTQNEIDNLVSFFNLVSSKQMKISLMLVNTHMEEQPPLNNATWLNAILNAIKNHPALGLVVFDGDTHMVDTNGDGIGDACGNPAEAPLWLGPSSKPANYVKWAIQYAMSLGMPANKLTSEAIVGNYYADLEGPAGPDATDGHLWKSVRVLKQIFDELSIPENQRTYGISFYEHRKCNSTNSLPCIDADHHTWADETLKQIFEIIGRKGSRVIAIEMGLSQADPNWTTAQAFESQFLLMKRYGVAGGCFWHWVNYSNDEDANPTLATPIKKRGLTFEYNPVKDKMVQYYLGMLERLVIINPGYKVFGYALIMLHCIIRVSKVCNINRNFHY